VCILAIGDFSPTVAGGTAIVLITVFVGALFKLLTLLRTWSEDRESDNDNLRWECSELRADLQWERQINSNLIRALHVANVEVPPGSYAERPASRDRPRASRRRKRGAGADVDS
jgi:hypothetical protein